MATHTHHDAFGATSPDVPTRLRFWSFAMLPLFFVGSVAAMLLGTWFMDLLGVPEGELLTTAGFYGWCAAAVVVAVMCIAPVVGMRLAYRSQALRPNGATLAALITNAVALLYVLITTAASWYLATH